MLSQKEAILVELAIIQRALEIVRQKRRDYSGKDDPFRNLRSSEIAGVDPWRGAQVRHLDKLARRRSLMEASGQAEVNEPLLDTWADGINYTAIEAGLQIEVLGMDMSEMIARANHLRLTLDDIMEEL